MADDWKPGDLALCIKMGPWEVIVGGKLDSTPRPGGIYKVVLVSVRRGLVALELEEFGFTDFVASRFKRLPPHEADAEDAETIRLLTGKPVREPAA